MGDIANPERKKPRSRTSSDVKRDSMGICAPSKLSDELPRVSSPHDGTRAQPGGLKGGREMLTASEMEGPTGTRITTHPRRGLTRTNTTHYMRVHEAAMAEIFRAGTGTVGLRNLGNTCYMNACVQALCHTVGLADYFLGYDWQTEINDSNPLGYGGRLARAFGTLLEEMWSSQPSAVAPARFKRMMGHVAPMFAGNEQHDTQELLTFLLDALHEDLNRCRSKPYVEAVECHRRQDEDKCAAKAWRGYLLRDRSIIVDLFQGQLRSTVRCATCGYATVKFDPFMYLSVPVPAAATATLEECIEQFSAEEVLDGDNAWYCAKCKARVTATKTLELWKPPPVLVVHLKRFSVDERGRARKLTTNVTFPLTDLDLEPMCKSPQRDPPLYDCYSVVNHRGSVNAGHYTAFARNRVDCGWYDYNDARVSLVGSPEPVQTSDAYVLFFARVVLVETDAARVSSSSVSSSSRRRKRVPRLFDRTKASRQTDAGCGVLGPPSFLVRRQSISLPHLWPHYHDDQADPLIEPYHTSVNIKQTQLQTTQLPRVGSLSPTTSEPQRTTKKQRRTSPRASCKTSRTL